MNIQVVQNNHHILNQVKGEKDVRNIEYREILMLSVGNVNIQVVQNNQVLHNMENTLNDVQNIKT